MQCIHLSIYLIFSYFVYPSLSLSIYICIPRGGWTDDWTDYGYFPTTSWTSGCFFFQRAQIAWKAGTRAKIYGARSSPVVRVRWGWISSGGFLSEQQLGPHPKLIWNIFLQLEYQNSWCSWHSCPYNIKIAGVWINMVSYLLTYPYVSLEQRSKPSIVTLWWLVTRISHHGLWWCPIYLVVKPPLWSSTNKTFERCSLVERATPAPHLRRHGCCLLHRGRLGSLGWQRQQFGKDGLSAQMGDGGSASNFANQTRNATVCC